MQVLIVRHGMAEDRDMFAATGQPDELRPLTKKGQEKTKKATMGIRKLVPVLHRIVASPLVRAQQTAEVLSERYQDSHIETLEALSPDGDKQDILSYLQTYGYHLETIALVGHEPDLGELATWLLSGEQNDWMPLKKGSACLLEFNDEVEAGTTNLLWYLIPKQLRQLAD
ncbi:phosphohistidine phosphatase SixA [Candidatus Albibeggiatoa sp. nov. NOAA]|uniref:phosphohistidine phosphatase SixA n=1 Tax=Candidatus Albibeggiatoa sp. nov. NOAA TaxID=3162724 RepID=UPI0032FCE4A9|nr:phosphohistidine phosphatase SixA [Thiotrichaceae bacterium]